MTIGFLHAAKDMASWFVFLVACEEINYDGVLSGRHLAAKR